MTIANAVRPLVRLIPIQAHEEELTLMTRDDGFSNSCRFIEPLPAHK